MLLLRPGPDRVPYSTALLGVGIALSLLVSLVVITVIIPDEPLNAHLSVALLALMMFYYYVVLSAAQKQTRFVQTMTAMLGCDILLSLIQLVVFVVLALLADRLSAIIIVQLIALWSIPVQGNIVARALGQHWLLGIGIAFAGFILSMLAYTALTPSA